VGWWKVRSRATRIIRAEGRGSVVGHVGVRGGSLQERFMRDQAASDRLIQSSRALLILARSAPGTSFSEFMSCVHVCEQAQLLFLNPLSAESSPFSGLIGFTGHFSGEVRFSLSGAIDSRRRFSSVGTS
jgi:hypothetical protein